MDYFEDDTELEDLRAQVFFERQRNARLSRAPDCRDPDHPGCPKCMEIEDEC